MKKLRLKGVRSFAQVPIKASLQFSVLVYGPCPRPRPVPRYDQIATLRGSWLYFSLCLARAIDYRPRGNSGPVICCIWSAPCFIFFWFIIIFSHFNVESLGRTYAPLSPLVPSAPLTSLLSPYTRLLLTLPLPAWLKAFEVCEFWHTAQNLCSSIYLIIPPP